MANKEHLDTIKKGANAWNKWRKENFQVKPDFFNAELSNTNLIKAYLSKADLRWASLTGANLSGAILSGADIIKANLSKANLSMADLTGADLTGAALSGADLMGADLSNATLSGADLSNADLSNANLSAADLRRVNLRKGTLRGAELIEADLSRADLSNANLIGADLIMANFTNANLSGADLSRANLISANLLETNLENAHLTGCHIYGISAWNLRINEETEQSNLIITHRAEPIIMVDDIEVAQFIYPILHNEKIRQVIENITTKVVLILGRFTPERKVILDAIWEELRRRRYIPVLFDSDIPESRDTQETITTLARLARFVIADISGPKSIPQELVSIIETLPSLAIQPLLQEGHESWGIFDHIERHPWVLAVHRYKDLDDLLATLGENVVEPAQAKAKELQKKYRKQWQRTLTQKKRLALKRSF